MAYFEYTVHDAKGNVTSGTSEGDSRESMARTLMDRDLTPVIINEVKKGGLSARLSNIGFVGTGEKVLFAEELSTLINAGVPIAQATSMLAKQTRNSKFKKSLNGLTRDIEGGLSLSSAMARHTEVFSPIFINMTRAGEIGGTLDKALVQLSVQLAKDHDLVSKVRGALIYPAVILVAMVGAMIYMMLTIVPELAKMFKQLGGKLPATTESLIFVSNLFTKYIVITIIVVVVAILAFRYAKKNIMPFRIFVHRMILHAPVFGNLTRKINISHFARTLSSLLTSGVNVTEALQIVSESTNNMIFKQALEKTTTKVQNGETIAENLKNFPVFPMMVPQMVAVGEETGSLDEILNKVADFYDREIDNITKNLTVLMEPMIMIFIGIMVGYLIISIITPIYTMTNLYQ